MKKPITHLKRTSIGGDLIHISHLYPYVSAYANTPEEVKELSEMLAFALREAKEKVQTQIVDRDGEFCFHVTPAGYIMLMIPWKTYKVDVPPELIVTYGNEEPPKPPTPPYQEFQAMIQVAMGDATTDVFAIDSAHHGIMMCVDTPMGPVYITKEQAKTFFNLKDKE